LNEVREVEKRKDFIPSKREQITLSLKHSDLKQKDIAKEANVKPLVLQERIWYWEERWTVQGWENLDGSGK